MVLWVFVIFRHLVTGQWRHYVPTTERMWAIVLFYSIGIFLGAPHPFRPSTKRKHTPLQAIVYLGFQVVMAPAIWISGIILWVYGRFPDIYPGDLLVLWVNAIHVATAFLISHLYLIATGETVGAQLRAMITGWDRHGEPDKGWSLHRLCHGCARATPLRKENRWIAHLPRLGFHHDALEAAGCQKSFKPKLQIGPGLGVKPGLVDKGELADKGKNGVIGKGRAAEDPAIDPLVELRQHCRRETALFLGIGSRVASRIFGPVERRFERAVIAGNPVEPLIGHVEPAFRVVLPESPHHDIQALVDHVAGGDKARHGAAGRGLQKSVRFLPQHHLAELHRNAGRRDGQPRANGIGAAAE